MLWGRWGNIWLYNGHLKPHELGVWKPLSITNYLHIYTVLMCVEWHWHRFPIMLIALYPARLLRRSVLWYYGADFLHTLVQCIMILWSKPSTLYTGTMYYDTCIIMGQCREQSTEQAVCVRNLTHLQASTTLDRQESAAVLPLAAHPASPPGGSVMSTKQIDFSMKVNHI